MHTTHKRSQPCMVRGAHACRREADPYLMTPAADEGDLIEEGGLDDLGKGLHHILHINVTDQQPEPEAALQLLDAVVHVLWLQQVKPVHSTVCLASVATLLVEFHAHFYMDISCLLLCRCVWHAGHAVWHQSSHAADVTKQDEHTAGRTQLDHIITEHCALMGLMGRA